MVRTVFFSVFVIFYVLFSLVFMLPVIFYRITRQKDKVPLFIQKRASGWARILLKLSGCRVTVKGSENIPNGNFLIIGNHQSNFDILVVIANIPKLIGFIAKKELSYIPVFSFWMKQIGCLIIDRKNMKKASITISEGAARIMQGQSLVVFPEGHRSKSPVMAHFKPGSLKLASLSGATILPVTISGSYKAMEEKGLIKPADIKFTIHKPIDYSKLTEGGRESLLKDLEKTISAAI